MVSEGLVSRHFVLGQNITVVEHVAAAILHGTLGRKHRGRRAGAHPGSQPAAFHLLKYPASSEIALPVGPNQNVGVKDTHTKAPQRGDIAEQDKDTDMALLQRALPGDSTKRLSVLKAWAVVHGT